MNQADDEEDEEQQEKVPTEAVNENDNDASMPEAKPAVVAVNDDDEPMAEVKNDEGLNNGSPDEEETRSQKNEADDSKELADGEIADLSGDESKAADAPETIDLGKKLNSSLFFKDFDSKLFEIFKQLPIQRVRLMRSQAPVRCTRPAQYFCVI